jgi:uncharacterized protein YndB with AHSA1/START domain
MRVRSVESSASPERVWALIARPGRWSEWSPHVRGAEGLGSPTVRAGARGSVVLRGGMRTAARVTDVVPGESWTWEVGGLTVRHSVRPTAGGCRIEHEVTGSSRAWSAVAVAYAPIIGLIARNIARVAERGG